MSTIQDFDNAPVGATATTPNGHIAFKTGRPKFEWSIYDSRGTHLDNLHSDEMVGYTLNPTAPTTAREALDLGWELAHPVKEGQMFPAGTRYVLRSQDGGLTTFTASEGWTLTPRYTEYLRTLDPLPDPEPDWLDAPAILAATILEDRSKHRTVFARDNKTGTQWLRDTKVYRWDELIDVVPLYPKEDA